MLSQQEFLEKCWEAEVLITSLLRLTENKAITWECLEYEPPALIEATDLFLSQKLVVRTEYEGDPYQAELLETIEVKPGKGSLDLSIFIGEEPRNREESIERYITFFPENLVKPFSDLLFKLVGDSVARSPSWDNSQYVYQRFPAETLKHPIVVLGKKLFEQKQAWEFHQICSDSIALHEMLEEQAKAACGSPDHCCCFSGHRPEKLTATEKDVKNWLEEKVKDAINDGISTFITGMARGVDLWAGEIILRLKEEGMPIRLICASPYFGFEEQWSEKWRLLYHSIISGADAVTYVSQTYSQSCFQKRNEWMVDRSSRVIAVFNGSSGGTKNTIDYARKHHCEIIS